MQSLEEYGVAEEEKAFLKAVSQGLMDIREGRTSTTEEARKKLGLS